MTDSLQNRAADAFGHKILAGAARYLEEILRFEIGCKVRSIELNVKTPVFKAFYTVHDFQEKAFWNLSAFQAVFYAQIAALIMIGGIELTSGVRTWTKLNFTHFSLLLILSFIYN